MSTLSFLGHKSRDLIPGCPVLFGCPLDLTCTYRKGTGEAPDSIRLASDSIETYSPLLDRDLCDVQFSDLGDLDLAGQSLEASLKKIREATLKVLENGAKPVCIGGEHTLTLPIVEAVKEIHGDFLTLHLDAHSDLRDNYEGSAINHATVIHQVCRVIGPTRLLQLGVRAGTKEEFCWMSEHGTLMEWTGESQTALLKRISDLPIYLTLDLDVLDPSCFPGTGNPEPGGWFYQDLEKFFRILDQVNVVGADIVELNPTVDPSGMSSITAAKIVREILLILAGNSDSS